MGAFLCCCCGFGGEPAFPRKEGRVVKRTITDICGLVVFWVFAALMAFCLVDGFTSGDIKRLTHGADWEGNLCGIDAVVKEKPYMMFCGSPERVGNFPKYIIQGSSACVAACPTIPTNMTGQLHIDCLMPAYHNFTTYKSGSIGSLANVETLAMTLTQSVTTQLAYPTEPFGGRFCLPSGENPELRDLIINGPWGRFYRPMVTVGGLIDAWPLFLLAAGLACLLGLFYMWLLQKYAGCVIFVTMAFSTLLSFALGIFFFFAVIMDMDDTTTDYAKFNPIMSVFVGHEAKLYSVVTGIIIILASVLMGAVAATSIAHIDEMIGLISASCECLSNGAMLRIFPLVQGVVFVALFTVFFFVGLPRVMSLGSLDYTEITVDGDGVEGLERVWKRNWLQHYMLVFYSIGVIFLLELYIQMGHYLVSYTACSWYFTAGHDVDINNNKVVEKGIGMGQGKKVEVRVAGVDPNYGPRQGSVVMTQAGKMLVVPVGRKGPGLGRNDMEKSTFVKGPVACGTMTGGLLSVLFYHIGSLTVGSPIIFFFRPFRMAAKFMHHFNHSTKEHAPHWNDHKAHHRHEESGLRTCMSLSTSCMEQLFGPFSKDAFTELVLNGTEGFLSCSATSFSFIHHAGGTITHLHGAMMMFEMFGTFFITIFSGWVVLIVQDKVDVFNDPTSSHYVEDKTASALAASVLAFAVAFAFMSTWNQIADDLLYCVAWNRKQLIEGEEHKFEESEIIEPVNTYMPQNLRYLMPEHEREAAPHEAHKAEGMGHMMQIMATMEHGIMNTLSGEGPGGSSAGSQGGH